MMLVLFAALGGKLVVLQVSDGHAYAAIAEEKRMARVTLVANRGTIADRNGNPLARSVPASAVYADPKYVGDPVKTAQLLSGLLDVPETELVANLSRKLTDSGKEVRFVYLARELDTEIGAAVQKMIDKGEFSEKKKSGEEQFAGIGVLTEQRRDVPSRDIASNLVGFTGRDGYGLAGLEATLNDALRGKDGKRAFEVGLRGQEIPAGYSRTDPARPGAKVTLTIDRDLQYETQRMLNKRLDEVRATVGSAIVMDTHTGEILSMASYPSYDASQPQASKPEEHGNVGSSMVLEPGSVHKAITLSAALEEKKIQPDSAFAIAPTIQKGDKVFKDTHTHTGGRITLSGILAKSSNVGTITVADLLGAQKLYEYQRKFGLGTKIGIGVGGESAGLVQPPSRWSGPSYGGIPIGIGVAATPLQMTAAYAAIANDGKSVRPKLFKDVAGPDSAAVRKVQQIVDAKGDNKQIISPETAKTMREAMEAVATEEGTAPKAAVSGYRVAGKTGTGLRVINNKYASGDVASFIGMVPADKPRYVISIFAHVPNGGGGAVTGPVFSSLASFALRHYGVPPTGTAPASLPLTVP